MSLERRNDDDWNCDVLYDALVCPVCGGGSFVGRAGGFTYCSECNARVATSQTVNEDGFLVTVDSTTIFPEFAAPIPGETVHGKFVDEDDPELVWWATPTVDGEKAEGWSPADRRSSDAT